MIVTTYHDKPLKFSRESFERDPSPISFSDPSPIIGECETFLFIALVGSKGVKLAGPARKLGVFALNF